jgi:amidase
MSDWTMDRRAFLECTAMSGAAASGPVLPALARVVRRPIAPAAPFHLEEATIAGLQAGLASGKYTARSLVAAYLQRIEDLDRKGPTLRAVLEANPDALAHAAALDAERKAKGPRGPLHGIPVLVKDNVATRDRMQSTAGSLALVGVAPPRDAFLVERLRAAGAVLLGKANLSEWANFRSTHSSSGWSGRGGQCRNPYALDRTPSGSSSGSGVAVSANLCAVAIGTETDGSIVSPATCCGIVGIKPTLGLVSRAGVIPIAHSQDTAGPMARTVADAAILLGALTGIDERDEATASAARAPADYTSFLDPAGLKGARLGVCRSRFMGNSPATDAAMEGAIDTLKLLGAVIVDPADIATAGQFRDSEFAVLLYEFKADLNKYLDEWAPGAGAKTLEDLIAFNERTKEKEMPYFGQEIFIQAQAKGPLTDEEYVRALDKNHLLARTQGIDAVMAQHQLDALIAPTGRPASLIDLVNGDPGGGGGSFSSPAAVAGYPHVTVPMGYVRGLPVGLSFVGRPWSEGMLIKLAFAYEQATKVRRPPRFLATTDLTTGRA